MNILFFGDLLGKQSVVNRILKLNLSEFDALVYLGDTPDPSVFKALRESKVSNGIDKDTDIEKELIGDTLPHKALQKATDETVSICKLLREISIPFYGVLGNADLQYYSQFVKWPFISLHNKVEKLNEYHLLGYNGRPVYQFENENCNENAFTENDIVKDLSNLFEKVDPSKAILVTHPPPFEVLDQVEEKMRDYAFNTYGERAKNGNIGSTGLKRIVNNYNLLLHVFGHIHESKGIKKNNTTFVNIGSTGENEEVCKISIQNTAINVSFVPLP